MCTLIDQADQQLHLSQTQSNEGVSWYFLVTINSEGITQTVVAATPSLSHHCKQPS